MLKPSPSTSGSSEAKPAIPTVKPFHSSKLSLLQFSVLKDPRNRIVPCGSPVPTSLYSMSPPPLSMICFEEVPQPWKPQVLPSLPPVLKMSKSWSKPYPLPLRLMNANTGLATSTRALPASLNVSVCGPSYLNITMSVSVGIFATSSLV